MQTTLPGERMDNAPLIKELDFTPEEWGGLLELSIELKAARAAGREPQQLFGINLDPDQLPPARQPVKSPQHPGPAHRLHLATRPDPDQHVGLAP